MLWLVRLLKFGLERLAQCKYVQRVLEAEAAILFACFIN